MPLKSIGISEAKAHLNTIDADLAKHRVIMVTRNNENAFAIVDLEFLSSITETLEILSDPQCMDELLQSQDDIRAGRLYSHEQVENELG